MQSKENVASDGSQELGKVAKKRKNKDQLLIGWDEIASQTPFSTSYLRNKHGKELKEKGYIFKSNIGNSSSPMVWSYPDFIRGYVIFKAKQKGGKF